MGRAALFAILAGTLGLGAAVVAERGVLAPGAEVQKLAGDFKFTEGPACDAEGNVFFTDQPNDRILKWSVDGKLSTFMQPCGRSNGLCFDREGNLWACADEKNELWCIDSNGNVTVVVKDYQGKPKVRLRPRGYGDHVVVEVQQGRRFELRVFDVRAKGKLVHTVGAKGDGVFGQHGRVSATVQHGRAILLSKDKLAM